MCICRQCVNETNAINIYLQIRRNLIALLQNMAIDDTYGLRLSFLRLTSTTHLPTMSTVQPQLSAPFPIAEGRQERVQVIENCFQAFFSSLPIGRYSSRCVAALCVSPGGQPQVLRSQVPALQPMMSLNFLPP